MTPKIPLHVEIFSIRFKNRPMPSKRSLKFITGLRRSIRVFSERTNTYVGPTTLSPPLLGTGLPWSARKSKVQDSLGNRERNGEEQDKED